MKVRGVLILFVNCTLPYLLYGMIIIVLMADIWRNTHEKGYGYFIGSGFI